MNPVKIELTPYNALSILKFLREFINEENADDYQFKAIHEAVEEYEKEIYNKVSISHLKDAEAENEVNKLIGKSPQ